MRYTGEFQRICVAEANLLGSGTMQEPEAVNAIVDQRWNT